MGTLSEPGNYRPGAFPHADDAEMFGMLYLKFAEARNLSKQVPAEDRGSAIEDEFQAAFYWALPKAELDKKFMEYYGNFLDKDGRCRPLTPNEMNSILGRMKGALERANMYGYKPVPEDYPEQVH